MNAFSPGRLTVAGIVIFVTAGFTGQVSAVPFTYSYLAGFVEGSEVTSGGGMVFQLPTVAGAPQAGDVIEGSPPLPGDTFRQIKWIQDQAVQSRLTVTNTGDDEAPQSLPTDGTLVQLAKVEHENNVIPQTFNYTVDFAASLRIFDQATQRLLFDDLVTITFNESLNAEPCVPPNPTGSPTPCDDSFQLSGLSLAPLFFDDLDSNTWKVNFTLGNFVNSAFDPATFKIFTGEGTTSSVDLLMNIERNENPEPEPLLLIGLGLLGLGLTRWRGKRATHFP